MEHKTTEQIVQEFEKIQRFAPGVDFSRPFAEIAEQIRKAESDFLLTHLNAKDRQMDTLKEEIAEIIVQTDWEYNSSEGVERLSLLCDLVHNK